MCSNHKCGLELLSAAALKKHTKHHKDSDYICKVCGATFPYASELEQHSYVHLEDKLFECHYSNCQECYKIKYDAEHHYKRHHSTQTFKCDDCDKVLDSKTGTQQHVQIHSNDLPVKCPVCGAHFGWQISLK